MNREDLKYLTEKIPSLTSDEIKNFSDDIEFREFKSGDIYIKQGEQNQKLHFHKAPQQLYRTETFQPYLCKIVA